MRTVVVAAVQSQPRAARLNQVQRRRQQHERRRRHAQQRRQQEEEEGGGRGVGGRGAGAGPRGGRGRAGPRWAEGDGNRFGLGREGSSWLWGVVMFVLATGLGMMGPWETGARSHSNGDSSNSSSSSNHHFRHACTICPWRIPTKWRCGCVGRVSGVDVSMQTSWHGWAAGNAEGHAQATRKCSGVNGGTTGQEGVPAVEGVQACKGPLDATEGDLLFYAVSQVGSAALNIPRNSSSHHRPRRPPRPPPTSHHHQSTDADGAITGRWG